MKKARQVIIGMFLTVMATSPAMAYLVTYDFDSLSTGTYSESNFSNNFSDVTFDNLGGDNFTVDVIVRGASLTNVVYDKNTSNMNSANATEVIFDNFATNYISVDFKTRLIDEGVVYMQGYNYFGGNWWANPNLYVYTNITDNSGWVNLEIINNGVIGIKKVKFWSEGIITTPLGNKTIYNTVYWDNFTFEKGGSSNSLVPEPSALFLLGSGLLGLLGISGLRGGRGG